VEKLENEKDKSQKDEKDQKGKVESLIGETYLSNDLDDPTVKSVGAKVDQIECW